MKKEVKILAGKSEDSLILAIEHFNRPWDCGRKEVALILLDHAFELLLKAALRHKGHRIREKRKNETYGFDKCVRVALSNKIITEEQVLTLQTLNSLRDAAQHYFIELSEQHFYFQAQNALTVYKDILMGTFGRDLIDSLPKRVLPISTTPLSDINVFFENELSEVKKMLTPGKRKKIEADSIIRGLTIFDRAIQGEKEQPSISHTSKVMQKLKQNKELDDVFPGIASINISVEGSGPTISLRFTKKEGIPIYTVPEGTPGAHIVAVKRVNELDYYNLPVTKLAEHIGLTQPKTSALIKHLKIKEDETYFKQISLGKSSKFNRYSQETIKRLKEELPKVDIDKIWEENRHRRKE